MIVKTCRRGVKTMKKIVVIVLILLFIFALIRITTSTYENNKRRNNAQAFPIFKESIVEEFLFQF